jgi:hypothetical protein
MNERSDKNARQSQRAMCTVCVCRAVYVGTTLSTLCELSYYCTTVQSTFGDSSSVLPLPAYTSTEIVGVSTK